MDFFAKKTYINFCSSHTMEKSLQTFSLADLFVKI